MGRMKMQDKSYKELFDFLYNEIHRNSQGDLILIKNAYHNCLKKLDEVRAKEVKERKQNNYKPIDKQIILRSADGLETKPFVVNCGFYEWKTLFSANRETFFSFGSNSMPIKNLDPIYNERLYRFQGQIRDGIEIFEEVI